MSRRFLQFRADESHYLHYTSRRRIFIRFTFGRILAIQYQKIPTQAKWVNLKMINNGQISSEGIYKRVI